MKVLLVRLSAIGDVIQGIPALVALKETFPDWRISWLVEETASPLLEGHSHLDRVFVLRRKRDTNFLETLRRIRAEKFDAAVDLQGLLKSAIWTVLSGARRRIGHRSTRELAHLFYNERVGERAEFDPAYPLIERYLNLARHLGADAAKARYVLPAADSGARAGADALLGAAAGSLPMIALCPRSHWHTKDWPLQRWSDLARRMRGKARVLLIGGAKDQQALEEIAQAAPEALNLAGKTSLPLLAEIFSRCACVVGGDTGPTHLANAVSAAFPREMIAASPREITAPRVIMIFGATSSRRSGPWGSPHRAVSLALDCQPCFERTCKFGHMKCLAEISVARIEEEIAAALR